MTDYRFHNYFATCLALPIMCMGVFSASLLPLGNVPVSSVKSIMPQESGWQKPSTLVSANALSVVPVQDQVFILHQVASDLIEHAVTLKPEAQQFIDQEFWSLV